MMYSEGVEKDYYITAKEYRERLNIALKAAKICVFEVDLVKQLYTFFQNSEDIFGVCGEKILEDVQPFSRLSPKEYQEAASAYFAHPDDFDVIDEAFQSIFAGKPTTYQARMRAAGSEYKWCKLDVSPVMENGVPVRMIGVITDITSMKKRTDNLELKVRHDGFTGLYNKESSIELIREIFREQADKNHVLVLMDIDNFKHVNDTYGHAVGDEVIQLVAESLKKSFREEDVVGRFGGDEFIVLIRDVTDIKWLKEKLDGLVSCRNEKYSCTNSIGAAVFPRDGMNFDVMFQKADKALYQAKVKKQQYIFFE